MLIEEVAATGSTPSTLNRQPVTTCIINDVHTLREIIWSSSDQNRSHVAVVVVILEDNGLCSTGTAESWPLMLIGRFVLKAYAYRSLLGMLDDLLSR